ncbi:fluoride efflux transporter FluC [Microcella humidisoli]|uniref:Fluoride-specific ion channel FluC n=1 Tax=Microcella humidisoli TaxID=2963406 RepID=A0ABY5FYZ3_9MICO|nr:CrcB family protein [Microcella humidisoli]UTT63352.1 CrcB family protein [Microcella humidisoli]
MVPHLAARLALVTVEARSRVGASRRDLLAVFVGGLIGTTLRVSLDLAIVHDLDEFALSTLLVNVVGAFVLGLLVAALWPRVPGWVRVGLGPGILGSFTTFSALAISVVALAQSGEIVGAVLSIVLSIGFGMLAAWAGLALGARLTPGQTPELKEVDE